MAIEKDDALILDRRRLGESSLIVTLFTANRGIVRAVAKGARRARSRFGGTVEPTNLVYAVYYRKENRDLQLLAQCDVVRSFPRLRESLLRLAYAYAIINCLIGLKREEGPAGELFRLAAEALGRMERCDASLLEGALWSFLLPALDDAGFRPELGRCLHCGRDVGADADARFDARAGGIVCLGHGGGGLTLSAGARHLLERSAAGDGEDIRPALREAAEGREALRRFLVEHGLGRSPFRPLEDLVGGVEEETF